MGIYITRRRERSLAKNKKRRLDGYKLDSRETQKLIDGVYSQLNYELDLVDKMKVAEYVGDKYLVLLNERYDYYYRKCRNDYDAFGWVRKIAKCMDAVSNYLLFDPNIADDNYTVEDNFEMLEKHRYKPIIQRDKIRTSNSKNPKVTIQSYLERDDVPDYIYDYVNFANSTRHTISEVQKQCERISHEISDDHVFLYKNLKGEDTYTTYEDYSRLRRVTGYTKNNSIKLDKEILSMLTSHYETLNSSNSNKNIWTEIMADLNSSDGLDIDLLDRQNIELLTKGICYLGDSETMDVYFDQIIDLAEGANFTELQKKIFDKLKEGQVDSKGNTVKASLGTIAIELNKSRSHIYSAFDSMVTKLSDAYEKIYEDYYYTYIARGKYKTCTKCGKIYLATKFYFYSDATKEDGLRSYCIDCTE